MLQQSVIAITIIALFMVSLIIVQKALKKKKRYDELRYEHREGWHICSDLLNQHAHQFNLTIAQLAVIKLMYSVQEEHTIDTAIARAFKHLHEDITDREAREAFLLITNQLIVLGIVEKGPVYYSYYLTDKGGVLLESIIRHHVEMESRNDNLILAHR